MNDEMDTPNLNEEAAAATPQGETTADAAEGAVDEGRGEGTQDAVPEPARPSTPGDETPIPTPGPNGKHDLDKPGYYLNRELTWLTFNFRVLNEAQDERTPLLERLKFIAIVSSNLDEFFMKRVGGLKQQVGAGMTELTVDGRSPQQQIRESVALVRDLEDSKRSTLDDIHRILRATGISIETYEEVSAEDRAWLHEHFVENIYPLITPQATDPAHPFPFISNLSLNLLVSLRHGDGSAAPLARVKVPVGSGIPRFIRIPGRQVFVPLESILAGNLDLLFPGMEVASVSMFRVTRNANTETAEEHADDLLSMIETELRERHFAPVVRLQVAAGIDPHHRGMLAAELGLDEATDVFEVEGMLGMSDLMEIVKIPEPGLHDAPHHPVDHPALVGDRSIFHVVRSEGSLLFHHPYQSFSTTVERFLMEASKDPKVRAIKMTLYRTSAETKAIDHLVTAARNGKQVAVCVELKARFDEAANIRWASRLERAGIHVTYGVVGLKTHCKIILVVRQDYDGLRLYAHVGTGNYHAATARLYSDLGLLTSDRTIGREAVELLNYLTTGFKPKRNYSKLLPAPKILKPALLAKIRREIALSAEGRIRIKTNALEDFEVTRELYRASQAGVRIELIVRDSCRIRPGIPGLSENISVISVVGRFLEHARVYSFGNGGAPEVYIGSADCMRRNLDSRVETLVAVEDPALRKEISSFLDRQIKDRRSVWDMQPDGSYIQRRPTKPKQQGCQEQMIDWAASRLKRVTRLKRRKPSGPSRRNVR